MLLSKLDCFKIVNIILLLWNGPAYWNHPVKYLQNIFIAFTIILSSYKNKWGNGKIETKLFKLNF
jgi:hypothetical protein